MMTKVIFIKLARKALFSLVLVLIIGELLLRLLLGLCDAVLMREDDDYEYIAQANQSRKRFGKSIRYNSYSMRSDEIRRDAVKILCLGDSVINGGTLTDQNNLATTLLESRLSTELKQDVQVLNISAGSWGPDNCAAYLRKHGTFSAKMIILICSSHDAYDTMDFMKVVGVNKSFPKRQYSLAWIELFDRYLIPRYFNNNNFAKQHHITRTEKEFNVGFEKIYNIAKVNNIPLCVVLHAEKSEMVMKDFNSYGQEIITFLTNNKIKFSTDINEKVVISDYYRKNDYIHLSDIGQEKLHDIIYKLIIDDVKKY